MLKSLYKCALAPAFSLLVFTSPAHAISVTDLTTHKHLVDQFNQMRQQFEVLQKQFQEVVEVKQGVENTVSAIGAAGRVILPYTNADKIKASLKRDLLCLIPNTELTLGVEFEDLNLSLCELGNKYLKSLSFFPAEHEGKNQSQIQRIKENIRKARENTLFEAASKGLAQADKGQTDVEEISILADDILLNSSIAQELKTMLAINNQASAGLLQAFAQLIQIELQQLRVQSATAIMLGLPTSTSLPAEEE